ncbi:MAG: MerR family transcriptional regulator [Bacteroidia bacterium]|nr:MerR family transcriptional regulator [Bacteroidia bacterium]
MEIENSDKVYYTISEVADIFKVNASLIRFWEKEFDVLKPHKNKKGNRLFTKKDLENIRLIYHYVKEKGFTLQGAREKMKTDGSKASKNVEVVDTLNRLKTFLLSVKADLDSVSPEEVRESNSPESEGQ